MVINFLGIGSAWNIEQDNTSAYIKKMILIDCGETVARKTIKDNVLGDIDELYILISYTYSDHIGNLGTLLFYSKHNKKIKNRIVLPNEQQYVINLNNYLKLVDISSEAEFVDSNMLKEVFGFKSFNMLRATHVKSLPCYCFVFEDDENLIYYSADNNIKYYIQFEKVQIYTEISNNSKLSEEHLDFGLLERFINYLQRKQIYLIHINESIKEEELKNKGFNIPMARKKEKDYGRKN